MNLMVCSVTSAAAMRKPRNQPVRIMCYAALDSLSADQRVQVQFTFTPQQTATAAQFTGGPNNRTAFVGEQYGQAVWSNFPVSDVPRPGLTLSSLSAEQRIAAMHLLQVLLSPKGYQKVVEIMNSDQVL